MCLSILRIKNWIGITLLISVVTACQNAPKKEDLTHLSGYWEIEEVLFPNGSTKGFPPGTTVDFYFVEGMQGYLKKVQPELNGRFRVNEDKVPMNIISRGDFLVLQFTGQDDTWEEVIEMLSAERLETRHDNGLRYRYRRFTPLNLTE